MKQCWIAVPLLLLAGPSPATQVFSHDTGRVRWEAEVTADNFALRERKEGAPGSTEFVCPLGPAVRATAVRTGSDAGRVCLVFSRDKCAYKSAEGASAQPITQSGAAIFKCADFATAERASALAALINAGVRSQRTVDAARPLPARSKPPTTAVRPAGPALPGTGQGNPANKAPPTVAETAAAGGRSVGESPPIPASDRPALSAASAGPR
jgi:hypothetical protein